MADKKISQLTAAAALTGSEPIPTVQSGVTVQTTAQDIADLYRTPNIVVPISADYELSADDVNKLLYITAPDVTLTMPVTPPFNELDKVYIYPNVNSKCEVLYGSSVQLINNNLGTNTITSFVYFDNILRPTNGLTATGEGSYENILYLYNNSLKEYVQLNISNATPTGIFDVAVPVDDAVGGSFSITTIVKDGTDIQVVTDVVSYTAIEVSGVITGDIVKSTTSTYLTSGTLTTAYSIIQNPIETDRVTILITATSSLTPTSIVSRAKLINNTNSIND